MIAALYIDPHGPYPSIPGVDCWDESRDARKYDGPWPVVAHPPCRHWSQLRHLAHVHCDSCGWSYRRIDSVSGAMYADGSRCPVQGFDTPDGGCPGRITSDADCARRAVEQVRKFGGVLEHPAGSRLWEACRLPLPFCDDVERVKTCRARKRSPAGGCITDHFGGYTIEVAQCEWGHVARKRTWLYLVGVPREALEAPPFPGRGPTHYASGGRTKSSRQGAPVPPGTKVCSAAQRRKTPTLFAEYLIRLARSVRQ